MDAVQRKSGFTIMELLVVIAIIGVLASLAYPSYQQYTVKANKAAAQQFLLKISSFQQQYFAANNGNGFASQAELFGAGWNTACKQFPVAVIKAPLKVCKFYSIRSTQVSNGGLDGFSEILATPKSGGNENAVMIDTDGRRQSHCVWRYNSVAIRCWGPAW